MQYLRATLKLFTLLLVCANLSQQDTESYSVSSPQPELLRQENQLSFRRKKKSKSFPKFGPGVGKKSKDSGTNSKAAQEQKAKKAEQAAKKQEEEKRKQEKKQEEEAQRKAEQEEKKKIEQEKKQEEKIRKEEALKQKEEEKAQKKVEKDQLKEEEKVKKEEREAEKKQAKQEEKDRKNVEKEAANEAKQEEKDRKKVEKDQLKEEEKVEKEEREAEKKQAKQEEKDRKEAEKEAAKEAKQAEKEDKNQVGGAGIPEQDSVNAYYGQDDGIKVQSDVAYRRTGVYPNDLSANAPYHRTTPGYRNGPEYDASQEDLVKVTSGVAYSRTPTPSYEKNSKKQKKQKSKKEKKGKKGEPEYGISEEGIKVSSAMNYRRKNDDYQRVGDHDDFGHYSEAGDHEFPSVSPYGGYRRADVQDTNSNRSYERLGNIESQLAKLQQDNCHMCGVICCSMTPMESKIQQVDHLTNLWARVRLCEEAVAALELSESGLGDAQIDEILEKKEKRSEEVRSAELEVFGGPSVVGGKGSSGEELASSEL